MAKIVCNFHVVLPFEGKGLAYLLAAAFKGRKFGHPMSLTTRRASYTLAMLPRDNMGNEVGGVYARIDIY